MALNDFERTLKKELVRQLQDLKKAEVDKAAYFYENKQRVHRPDRIQRRNHQGSNKRKYYDIIAYKRK